MALEGTLHDMPLADLFEVFRTCRRSGRLIVSRNAERGLIFVGSGQLLDAVLNTDPEGIMVAVAEDAVIRILSWSEADFVFEHDPAASQRPRRIVRDIDWLLAAAAKSARPQLSLDSLLHPAMLPPDAKGMLTLRVEEWQLLSALWPQQTLGMASAELGLSPSKALVLAHALVERGLLTLTDGRESRPSRLQIQEPAHQTRAGSHPRLIERELGAPVEAVPPKSILLKAIIRRVRAL